MKPIEFREELSQMEYPGRGIMIGKSADGKNAVIAYFIMGRSENSRNRIFEETANDGLQTKAFDESRLVDPSLVIYAPIRTIDDFTIVTNGDQTDTIFEYIDEGGSFEEALRTRRFEPDPPILTPRISGILKQEKGDFSYKLSILKSDCGNKDADLRFFYEYNAPISGEGHFIHTYSGGDDPSISFFGEPKRVVFGKNYIDCFTQDIWEALNEENKVSLFVRFINLETGELTSRIVNKNK